jgi:hypothetical protein
MRTRYNELNKPKQCFAESSTVAFATYLADLAGDDGRLACTFETEVNFPYEAIDTIRTLDSGCLFCDNYLKIDM